MLYGSLACLRGTERRRVTVSNYNVKRVCFYVNKGGGERW